MCEAEDAEAIYFGRDWTQRGMVIAGNYLHGFEYARDIQAAAVHPDDEASGAEVTRNLARLAALDPAPAWRATPPTGGHRLPALISARACSAPRTRTSTPPPCASGSPPSLR